MDDVDEIVQEFLVESYDSLDKLDSDFVALEKDPDDRERLANIFRTVHTVKGTSGFLDFPNLEKVAHVGENLLVPLRDGELQLNNEIVDSLLGMVDAIRQILGNVETTGGEGDGDYSALIAKLEHAKIQPSVQPSTQPSVEITEPTVASTAQEGVAPAESSILNAEPAVQEQPEPNSSAEAVVVPLESDATPKEPRTPEKDTNTKKPDSSPAGKTNTSLADSTVRINVDLLDQLMNLVGELVLTRNQILQHSQDASDNAVVTASQRLNLITSELQEGVMKTRMQPISSAWSKLPRVVRDLSASCGKKVTVEMEGADTELDKTILEAIKDPLTHIVRNSVDHGIEESDVRAAAGKPAEGTLLLRAFHEGGQVNIEIIDDGGGINIERVKDKAIEKGLITPEKAEAMSERELTNLVLLPGFSTAQKVTNVSGRGVGMDVVRTNIEKIGGSLELQSAKGQGTTLRIKIPLTLAIVPALIIRAADQRFAIPQVSLLELLRLDGERAEREIEMIHNVPVYRLRGNLLPLLYLDEQLRLTSADELEPPSVDAQSRSGPDQIGQDVEEQPSVNIVVLQAEDRQFGLVVDAISDTQEIVVKPLGRQLSAVSTFAGATIMGDGAVALILDVTGVAQHGGILTEHRDGAIGDSERESKQESTMFKSMLIADRGDGTRVAIELASVSRLEEFRLSDIEQTDIGAVVQYRGGILPLVSMISEMDLLEASKDSASKEDSNCIQVIVFSTNGQNVGVVVGEIIDVVEHPVELATDQAQYNSGSDLLVIQERVTKVVDLATTINSFRVQVPPGLGNSIVSNVSTNMFS